MTNIREQLLGKKVNTKEYKMNLAGLGYVPEIKRSTRESVAAVVELDGGSKETRVQVSSEDFSAKIDGEAIDSTYTIIPTRSSNSNLTNGKDEMFKLHMGVGRDMELYNSLDSVIKPLGKREKAIEAVRLLRGETIFEYGSEFPNSSISTSMPKVQDINYLRTVLDGVGYGLFDSYLKHDMEIPKSFNVVLSISVRPHELNSNTSKELSEIFCGDYEWTPVRYDGDYVGGDTDASIRFSIKEVLLTSECETQIKHHFRTKPTPRTMIGVSTGGSNISTEGFVEGILQPNASIDLNLSGNAFDNQLKKMAVQAIRERFSAPTFTMGDAEVYKLINQGVVSVKGKVVSLDKLVTNLKRVFGLQIVSRLNDKLFTDTDFTVANTDVIIFLGNLCKRSHYLKYTQKPGYQSPSKLFNELVAELQARGTEPTQEEQDRLMELHERRMVEEPSIIDTVVEEFNKLENGAQVYFLEDNLIPAGNLLHAIEVSKISDIIDPVVSKLGTDNAEYFERYRKYKDVLEGAVVEEEQEEEISEVAATEVEEIEDTDAIVDLDDFTADFDFDGDQLGDDISVDESDSFDAFRS